MPEEKIMDMNPAQEGAAAAAPSAAPEASAPEGGGVKRNKNAAEKRKRKLPRKVKVMIAVVLVAAIGFGAVRLIQTLLTPDAQPGTNAAFVSRGRLESFVSGWGSTTSKSKADLGKNLKGTVKEVNVKSGDRVNAGDVIFTVDPEDMQQDLDDALTDLDRVGDQLSEAINAINNLTVAAPFKGKLISLEDLKEGQTLSSGSKVGVLVDDTKMKLVLYFSYGYIDEIEKGMGAVISVPSSMSNIEGRVESVEKVRRITQDGSALFKVNLIMDNPGTLTKEMTATAVIKTPNGDATPFESGKLEYNQEEEITAKTSGEIISIGASEYHEYAKGAMLVQMKNDSLKTSLSSAQRSYDAGVKKVKELRESLDECVQKTPIDGVVTGLMIEEGDELSASGTAVVSIADLTKIVIDVNIDEMDISKVSAGMPVEILYDKADGQVSLWGELASVSLEAKSDNNGYGGAVSYFPARITINDPQDLMPGMGVQYRISAIVKEDCLLVPSSSVIYTMEGSTVVFVKTEQVTPEQTPQDMPPDQAVEGYTAVLVDIGLSDDTQTEIVSGLSEGQEINDPSMSSDYGGGGMAYYW